MASIIKDFTITTLNETLPKGLYDTCCARYNNNIYIFGGYSIGTGVLNTIYKFNCINKTIETLSVTLPSVLYGACCSIYRDSIYIFCGYGEYRLNTIYKFNCTNETIEQLNVTLPDYFNWACCSTYGDSIYIFGGYDGRNCKQTIYKFNCISNAVTTLRVQLPQGLRNLCCSIQNENIYIFGGYNDRKAVNTIYKFNCINDTISTLTTKLPQILYSACCSKYNNSVFIFGGNNDVSKVNTIYKFNCSDETITKLNLTLTQSLQDSTCATYNDDIYIFGGLTSTTTVNTIYDFSFILETYNIKYDISSNDGSKQYVELLDNSPITAITFNNASGTNNVEYIIETLTDTLQGSFEIDEIQNKHLVGFSTIINATSIQIPLNQRVEISISVDTNFYAVYTTYRPLANTFKLELYNNTSEDNRVDKTNYLTKVGELAGVLREESSLVEMSLTLELEELPLFNYVYIEQLNRYYYVTDIVSVKYKLWEISLSVDVLMSYKNALLSCSAFVDRNENSYDNTIIDKKRVIQQGYDIEVSTVTNELLDNTSTNNIVLTGFYVKSV